MRLSRGLARLDRSLGLSPLPAPLVVPTDHARSPSALEGELVWPDLAIVDSGRRVYVELVGFWTRAHVDHIRTKLGYISRTEIAARLSLSQS